MKTIYYEPAELWDLYNKNKDELVTKTRVIAENPDFDVMVFLTSEQRGKFILPNILVWEDCAEIYNECAVGEDDLISTAESIYAKYLDDDAILKRHFGEDDADADEDKEENEQELEIDRRESELYDAAEDFLYTVTGGQLEKIAGFSETDKIIGDLINRTCEWLSMEHGISVFRPMMLEDEDGEEFYDEYPYDLLTFED